VESTSLTVDGTDRLRLRGFLLRDRRFFDSLRFALIFSW
jgi:hypothetical protein